MEATTRRNRVGWLAQATQTSTSPNPKYQYLYDRFGNRWRQTYVQGPGQGVPMPLSFDRNNRISTTGFRYDAAGNLVMDNQNCYTYDAENRLSAVAPENPMGTGICGATTMTYVYDAAGQRVARRVNGTLYRQEFYDAAGHMIAETDGSGNTLRAEIYAGNRHLATWNSNMTYFNHADWLGTERVRTYGSGPQAGQVCQTTASLPFGDGVSPSGSCTPTPTFFTGKERDAESGLDDLEARYFGSSAGRFASSDVMGGDTSSPQSLNRYAYVVNNPLRYTDVWGLDPQDIVTGICGPDPNCAAPPPPPVEELPLGPPPSSDGLVPDVIPVESASAPQSGTGSATLGMTQTGLDMAGMILGPVGIAANLGSAGISAY